MDKIQFNQSPIGSRDQSHRTQLPIEVVDELAYELTRLYDNPDYRKWYCGVIYEFGIPKVEEWKRRAAEGKYPAKLFSKYVKDWRSYKNTLSASSPERTGNYDK